MDPILWQIIFALVLSLRRMPLFVRIMMMCLVVTVVMVVVVGAKGHKICQIRQVVFVGSLISPCGGGGGGGAV